MAKVDEFAIGDLHDAVSDILDQLHDGVETYTEYDLYDCLLCGATMYPCMDYTHEPHCPYEVIEKAIDAFDAAVSKAETKASADAATA